MTTLNSRLMPWTTAIVDSYQGFRSTLRWHGGTAESGAGRKVYMEARNSRSSCCAERLVSWKRIINLFVYRASTHAHMCVGSIEYQTHICSNLFIHYPTVYNNILLWNRWNEPIDQTSFIHYIIVIISIAQFCQIGWNNFVKVSERLSIPHSAHR